MNKIQTYKLLDFQEGVKERHAVVVPKGSRLLKVISLHDGIYLAYEILGLGSESLHLVSSESENIESHFYAILNKDMEVPKDSEFIDIVDLIAEDIENTGEQKIVLFPIYKFKTI